MTQPCPRQRLEATTPDQIAHRSHWHHDMTCSYCGSIAPEELMLSIEQGHELVPTDKSYKVYVRRPNPMAGRQVIVGRSSGPLESMPEHMGRPTLTERLRGRYNRAVMGEAPTTTQDKFYFQHLPEEDRHKFLSLLVAGRIRIAHPGYFYVLPFFLRRVD